MYKEVKKQLDKLVGEKGEFIVKSAIGFVMDNGRCNITPENIAECKKDIERRDANNKTKGITPFLSAEGEKAIVDIALEIKDIDNAELLVYIQDHINYNVGQETLNKGRMKKLLEISLDYIYQDLDYDPIRFVEECEELGIYPEELEILGYDEEVEKYEYAVNEQDKDITDD